MSLVTTEVASFAPERFSDGVLRLDDNALVALVGSDARIAPITKHARAVAAETLRRSEALQLSTGHDHRLRRGSFSGPREWGLAVCEALPPMDDLRAVNRFAEAASMVEARRDVVTLIVTHLAKVLPAGGGPAPERMAACIEVLADYEDTKSIYGKVLRGFSIPVVQIAARRIKQESKFMPTPSELLAACLEARRFWRDVEWATRRQIALREEAEAELVAHPASPVPEPTDPDWF